MSLVVILAQRGPFERRMFVALVAISPCHVDPSGACTRDVTSREGHTTPSAHMGHRMSWYMVRDGRKRVWVKS